MSTSASAGTRPQSPLGGETVGHHRRGLPQHRHSPAPASRNRARRASRAMTRPTTHRAIVSQRSVRAADADTGR